MDPEVTTPLVLCRVDPEVTLSRGPGGDCLWCSGAPFGLIRRTNPGEGIDGADWSKIFIPKPT